MQRREARAADDLRERVGRPAVEHVLEVVAENGEGWTVLGALAQGREKLDPPPPPVLRRTAWARLDCLLQVADRESFDVLVDAIDLLERGKFAGIESNGKRVFMCDTDSVITDAKLNDYPDLMEEFMWDGCGEMPSGP